MTNNVNAVSLSPNFFLPCYGEGSGFMEWDGLFYMPVPGFFPQRPKKGANLLRFELDYLCRSGRSRKTCLLG